LGLYESVKNTFVAENVDVLNASGDWYF